MSSETSDLRLSDPNMGRFARGPVSRALEMYGSGPGRAGVVSSQQHQSRGNDGGAQACCSPTTGREVEDSASGAVDFAFRNDIQRCETMLEVLRTNLRVCKQNGRTDAVAKMARELDRVMDALNEPS